MAVVVVVGGHVVVEVVAAGFLVFGRGLLAGGGAGAVPGEHEGGVGDVEGQGVLVVVVASLPLAFAEHGTVVVVVGGEDDG